MRGRRLLTILAVIIGAAAGGLAVAGSASADFQADRFRLINTATDQCADLSITSTTGNEVVQEPCTGRPTQVWLAQQVTPASLYVQLVNQTSGLCMDLTNVVDFGVPVVQAPCSPKLVGQQWQFVTAGGVPGPLKVVNRARGQCLEVKDGSLAEGATVQVSPCLDSAAHQVWRKIAAASKGSS
jgi:hypothetical protein